MAQGENDVWYMAMQQDMPNFNNWDLASNSVWKNYVLGKWCWEGLSGLDPDGNIFPELAESWEFDLDTLTTTITLRQGVMFHDGETMDADDVIFTFKALRNGGTYSSNIVNAFDTDGDGTVSLDEFDGTISSQDDGVFDGWTKVDQYTVKAVMGRSYGQFFLQTLGVPIIPEHIWVDHLTDDMTVDPLWSDETASIGTGPLEYHSGQTNVFRRMVKFTDYWGKDFTTPSGHYIYPQEVDEIYFKLYSSLDTAILALKSGQVDHIPWTVTPGYVPDLLQNPNTDIESISDNGYFYLAFNQKRAPMNRLEFRQAVSHTIDKDTIVDRYMGGYGQAGDSSEPPFWADWYNSSVKTWPFSESQAKSALTNKGWTGVGSQLKTPEGNAVPPLVLLTPPADYDPIRIKAGELIAKNMRDWLGIDIVAKPVDFDTLVAKMNAFDFDMLIIGWSLTSDPIANVFDILGPLASSNTFGFWSLKEGYENPWYNELYGVSTLADADTQAMAEKVKDLGDMAMESFNRDDQIKYTKWAQGILSEALPCNVLYYRVNNYAITKTWSGYIPYFGELLNVYSLGALTSGVAPPPIEDVNVVLNLPDKLPLGRATAGTVVVFNDEGKPIEGATVTMTSTGSTFAPASGATGADGVFSFTVTGGFHGYETIDVAASTTGGGSADTSKVLSVVAGVQPTAFLETSPDKLFLAAGESTDVDLYVTDYMGDPIEGVMVEIDEGLLGYGSITPTTATTDAAGMATMVYTAPGTLPMNKHTEVRLSLAVKPDAMYPADSVNTVTQFLVLMNSDPSEWQFVKIVDIDMIAANETNDTATVTLMVIDQDGMPVDGATITASYSNAGPLDSPPMTATSDAAGEAVFSIKWSDGIDTNATQVFFKNAAITNSVGSGAALTFKGTMMKELYGGYFTIADTPMVDPDTDDNLTFDLYVFDDMGMPADVDGAFIVGEPSDGSSAAWPDIPANSWNSLWDYAGINIFTDADGGTLSSGGYFVSGKMDDTELASMEGLYTTWDEFFADWLGGPVDELVNMTGFAVTGGHAMVTIEEDSVFLADNIPHLAFIPMARTGFYCTPDYGNYWWEVHGDTAWKMEFIMERTDTVYSVKYDFDTGIVRDYAPGNEANLDIWVYDQDNNPVEGASAEAFVSVYRASPYFEFTDAADTGADGKTSVTMTGLDSDGTNALTNPARQSGYIYPVVDYGWTTFLGTDVFVMPVQLYVTMVVSPIIQEEQDPSTTTVVSITVVDETGTAMPSLDVSFDAPEGGSLDTTTVTTDTEGKGSVTYTLPDILAGEDFAFGKVSTQAVKDGYGAASAAYVVVVYKPLVNNLPTITLTSHAATGFKTQATTITIAGKTTDDWGIDKVEVALDGGTAAAATVSGDDWSYQMTGLTVGTHSAVVKVTDIYGLTATVTMAFEILEPTVVIPAPEFSGVNVVDGTEFEEGSDVMFSGKVTGDSITELTWTLDGGTATDLNWDANGDWTFTVTAPTVGAHTVKIMANNAAENSTETTVGFTVKEKQVQPPPDDDDDETDYTWLYIVIVIIIVLIIVAAVFMSRGGGGAPAPEPEPEPEPEEEPEEEPEPEDKDEG